MCLYCICSTKLIVFCRFCEYATERIENMERHIKSKKHLRNYQKNPNKMITEEDKDRIYHTSINRRIWQKIARDAKKWDQ